MKLYSLIWSRFVASQMTPAVIDTMRVDLEQNGVSYRSTGSKLKFDGFTKVYADSKHKDNMLPDLENGDEVIMSKNQPNQHFTLPPARFTEAAFDQNARRKRRWSSFNVCTDFEYDSEALLRQIGCEKI